MGKLAKRSLLSKLFGVVNHYDDALDSITSLSNGEQISLNPVKAYQDRKNGFANIPRDFLQPLEGTANVLLGVLRLATLPFRSPIIWQLNKRSRNLQATSLRQTFALDAAESFARLGRGVALIMFSAVTFVFIIPRLIRSGLRSLSGIEKKHLLTDDLQSLTTDPQSVSQHDDNFDTAFINLNPADFESLLKQVLETNIEEMLPQKEPRKSLVVSENTQRARDQFKHSMLLHANNLTQVLENFNQFYQGADAEFKRAQLIKQVEKLDYCCIKNYEFLMVDNSLAHTISRAVFSLLKINAPPKTKVEHTGHRYLYHAVISSGSPEQLDALFAVGIDDETREDALKLAARKQRHTILSQLLHMKNTEHKSPSNYDVVKMCEKMNLLDKSITDRGEPLKLETLEVLVNAGVLIDSSALNKLERIVGSSSSPEKEKILGFANRVSAFTQLQSLLRSKAPDLHRIQHLVKHITDEEKQITAMTLIAEKKSERAMYIYPNNQVSTSDLKTIIDKSIQSSDTNIIDDFIEHYKPNDAQRHLMLRRACESPRSHTLAKHLIENHNARIRTEGTDSPLLHYLVKRPGNLLLISYLCEKGAEKDRVLELISATRDKGLVEYVEYFYEKYPCTFTIEFLESISTNTFYNSVARAILEKTTISKDIPLGAFFALHPYSQMRQLIERVKDQKSFDTMHINNLLGKFPEYFHKTEKGQNLIKELSGAQVKAGDEVANAIRVIVEEFGRAHTVSSEDVDKPKSPVNTATLFKKSVHRGEKSTPRGDEKMPDQNGPKK